jgi:hypothetical protein
MAAKCKVLNTEGFHDREEVSFLQGMFGRFSPVWFLGDRAVGGPSSLLHNPVLQQHY